MRVNYPAAQINGPSAASGPLSTSVTRVLPIPRTASGDKPAFVRVAVSAAAAHVKLGVHADTSTTVSTSDNIVVSGEALWLATFGLGAVAFLQPPPGGVAVASVAPLEDSVIAAPTVSSLA